MDGALAGHLGEVLVRYVINLKHLYSITGLVVASRYLLLPFLMFFSSRGN